ncbi:hypothetical protein [Streptomyces sp. NPDC053431]|uniref:hypothetical protein n=1 Tax=Streptomyces sp. NPDC053431 TaxID=3365703 RepID=UPI0037D1BA5E
MAGSGTGGLFTLAWGVFATGLGTIVATDFRGAAHAAARSRGTSVRFQRVVAAVFALVGPVVLVVGVRELMRGKAVGGDMPRLPVPFLLFRAFAVAVALWTMWRPGGWVRRAWAAGGVLRQGAAAVTALTWIGFALGLGFGQQIVMLVSWLLGGAAGLILLLLEDPAEERGRPGAGPTR